MRRKQGFSGSSANSGAPVPRQARAALFTTHGLLHQTQTRARRGFSKIEWEVLVLLSTGHLGGNTMRWHTPET